MTGLANKKLLYLESFTRLFSGAIFLVVSLFILKSGLLLNELIQKAPLYVCAFVCFIAGFNERFIPSIAEKFTKDANVKDE